MPTTFVGLEYVELGRAVGSRLESVTEPHSRSPFILPGAQLARLLLQASTCPSLA